MGGLPCAGTLTRGEHFPFDAAPTVCTVCVVPAADRGLCSISMMTKSYPAAATRDVASGSVKPMKMPTCGPVESRDGMKGAMAGMSRIGMVGLSKDAARTWP